MKIKTNKKTEMFYFTCNESKIYESFTFWNNLQENFFMTFEFIEMHLYIAKGFFTAASFRSVPEVALHSALLKIHTYISFD